MELRIFVEPQQGATYADQLAVARTAEAAGFGAFFRSDHYVAMNVDGAPGPTDSWITLGAIGRETSTIRLGTLVTSATFRFPGPLAISVAQVDEMSGGRVELGLGAGWFEEEHAAYAIPFPDVKERFDRFEAQLERYPANLMKAAVELAKEWRTDRVLRRLEAMLAVADKQHSLIITGNGDVLEPEHGLVAIGSGGAYAQSAALALLENTELSPTEIVQKSLKIAGDLCIYTNQNHTIETL